MMRSLPRSPLWRRAAAAGLLAALSLPVSADGLDALRDFTREVSSGKAAFTQTVTSPDGARKKSASGSFEFARPDRFRFAYTKPYEQLIVGDGQKVWLYDADLNQVTVRPMAQALGATPASLLAGAALDRDFELKAQPAKDGLDWVQALPKVGKDARDGSLREIRIGFKGKALAALEITDAFGQRSLLQFAEVQANPKLADEAFRFVRPKGADLIEQ